MSGQVTYEEHVYREYCNGDYIRPINRLDNVVRCRDCANYRENVLGCAEFGDEARGEYANVEPDGFCAWAVRRTQ